MKPSWGTPPKKARQIGLKTPFLSGPGMTGPMTIEIAGKPSSD
jgi:hypothetical protein